MQGALGRVGLQVASYSDERAAMHWAAHHTNLLSCAVLHIQLANKKGDRMRDLIEKCAQLKVPTVVLQLVPPGFEAPASVARAMAERLALCKKLGAVVASNLNVAQKITLELVSTGHEFGANGKLQRLPEPTKTVPEWQPPRADPGDKMPLVNGAGPPPKLGSQPKPNPGARQQGKRNQYHLAPSKRGAGTVEYTYGEFHSIDRRQEQKPERPPQARHEGAQIVTNNNRAEPSWAQKVEEQNLRLVGAMRVHVRPTGLDLGSLPALPASRTQGQAAQSRRRLYARPPQVGRGVVDGATLKDLRSRFELPPVMPGATAKLDSGRAQEPVQVGGGSD